MGNDANLWSRNQCYNHTDMSTYVSWTPCSYRKKIKSQQHTRSGQFRVLAAFPRGESCWLRARRRPFRVQEIGEGPGSRRSFRTRSPFSIATCRCRPHALPVKIRHSFNRFRTPAYRHSTPEQRLRLPNIHSSNRITFYLNSYTQMQSIRCDHC
jgi:hypothetical protein